MTRSAIIIGAGYGGLALANLLAKSGYTVDVYEKHAVAGGRAGEVVQDGFTFDTGPSWYLMPEVFDQYYKSLGLSAKKELDIIRLKPGYRVFFENNEPITIQGNLKKDSATFESIEPGAGKKLVEYVNRSDEIYQLSVKHFLYTNFQSAKELLHKDILRSGGRMLSYAMTPIDQYVSQYMDDLRLKQILEYHMVFLGSSPFEAPAIYSLMSTLDFKSGVYYPKRGMYSLVRSLVSIGTSLGVRYHFNEEVKEISVSNGMATGIHMSDGTHHIADEIISNADLHYTETQLVPKAYQSFPESYWKKRQSGPSALLISLGVKGKIPQLLHHNLFFVDEWRENFEAIYKTKTIPENASLYVCNPSKTDKKVAPKGHENIFILVPLPAGIELTATEQAKLVTRFITQFSEMADIPDLAERIVTEYIFGPNDFATEYYSWQSGALGGQSHKLFQSAIFRTPNKSKKVSQLYYVGAGTTPGIGLPMCLMSAQLVYKRIAGIRTSGPVETI